MRYPTTIAVAALLALAPVRHAPANAATQAAQEQPSQVIETAARQTLKALDANREGYRKNPAQIQGIVDKYLLPHFDTQLAAQSVLGRYWRIATPVQRQEFISAFIHSMLDNYGSTLLDFTANTLKVYPSRVPPDQTVATVRTELTRTNGGRDSVIFYMRKTPQGWKAFDVHIDGISYILSYREDFQSQISQQGRRGIEAVIKRLESGEKPAQISHITGRRP
jgi:phospholipid transport system substrate-binding protein